MSLYGHEISEEINVFEGGLDRWLKLDKGNFIGRDALLAVQAAGGPKRKIVGLEMVDRGIGRDGYDVLSLSGEKIGTVTSGSPAPFLKTNIAMALVPASVAASGEDVIVQCRANPSAGEAGAAAVLQTHKEVAASRGNMATAYPSSSPSPVSGSVLVLIQFDVCEELRLDQLQRAVNARTVQQPKTKHSVPTYVRYHRPPVVEPLEPLLLAGGERLEGEIKFYDYGVVSVLYQLSFSGDWPGLVHLASQWVWDVDFATRVEPIVRQRLERDATALVKPYARWLSEDYFIFHVREENGTPSSADLTRDHGREIAQIVRGDKLRLSEGECAEVLQSRISYYENDLTVIGWNAAFLYDSNAGAETAIQLLEYANSQLLEFRHYDELLTGVLDNVYQSLERKKGMLSRWRMSRSATRLHTVLLDIGELTERADNSIKFSQRYVCRASLSARRSQGGRSRLQGPGRAES
jgi:hypothetical protein